MEFPNGDIIKHMRKERASEGMTNQLSQAAELKKLLTKRADFGITTSEKMSASQAALMLGISGRVFEKTAITVVPRSEGVEITIGPDKERHLDNLTGWLKEGRGESQKLLTEGYKLLFLAGQASVNPPVDFNQVIESKGKKKIEILERIVPEIGQIKTHLDQGGRIQDLIREEQQRFDGAVYGCFESLSPGVQESLKKEGFSPENMFQSSSE